MAPIVLQNARQIGGCVFVAFAVSGRLARPSRDPVVTIRGGAVLKFCPHAVS
jgi:hypothetical protein